jgi:NTP pyrophosphatase (non-canonical NTP hydrolase)
MLRLENRSIKLFVIKEVRMSDQTLNEECLELLDAMEIGFELSDYEQSIEELAEEIFNK